MALTDPIIGIEADILKARGWRHRLFRACDWRAWYMPFSLNGELTRRLYVTEWESTRLRFEKDLRLVRRWLKDAI